MKLALGLLLTWTVVTLVALGLAYALSGHKPSDSSCFDSANQSYDCADLRAPVGTAHLRVCNYLRPAPSCEERFPPTPSPTL